MGKVIWTLSENEKKEIQVLYEKKVALENLINIIDPSNDKLYNSIITDYGKVMSIFKKWWSDMGQKYNWEIGHNWSVNFDTNEVTVE